MDVQDIYKCVCGWLIKQQQPLMPYRNFMIALGKLRERGIPEGNEGCIKVVSFPFGW